MIVIDGKKIQQLMFAKKICGRDLAALAQITPTTASKLIRGKTNPNPKTIGKLASALGVRGEDLILKEEKNYG